jgi:anti-sigma B factor antagonist
MALTLESQVKDDVVIIRCKGRIGFGVEIDALQAEVDKRTKIAGTDYYRTKRVVLHLGEADYIDSSGLGALVRMYSVLEAAGGGLKLCELSPTVSKTIEITNLEFLFPRYPSEAHAIDSFSSSSHAHRERFDSSKTRILCVDTSSDLLAGLNALLTRSGYEVFTTRYAGEVVTLAKATQPKVVICGPGMACSAPASAAMDKLRHASGGPQILCLPPDFHTSEAGAAGRDLLSQVRSLI